MNSIDSGIINEEKKLDKISVLHIDDEVDFLIVTKEYVEKLSDGQIQVTSLSDSTQAVETLKEKKYDAIVCDYLMPSIDGLDLLKTIKAENIIIPFIIFTGRSREEVVIQALNYGADLYLRKGGDARSQYTELINDIRTLVEHKRAATALKDSEEKFRQIFNNSKDGNFILCMDENKKLSKFIEVNDVACQWTGYSRSELLEMTPYDFDKDSFFQTNRDIVESFKRNGKVNFISKLYSKDGSFRVSEFDSHKFILGEKEVILTVVRDISEKEDAERRILENEEKFRRIFQYAKDAMYLHPVDEKGVPGKFIEINDKAIDLLGYSREEFLEMTPMDISHLRTKENISKIIREVIKIKEMTYESVHIAKDGKRIPVEGSSHIFDLKGKKMMLVIVRDISDRKKREEDLLESYNLYRNIFETTGTANLLYDKDGTILLFNSRLEKLSGYKKEEVEGKRKWTEFIPKPELAMMMKFNKERRIDPTKVPSQYESRIITKDGTIKDVILTVKYINETKNFIASLTDITERKKAEEEVSKQKEELSDFAHFMSHDIRNSLTAIEGYIEEIRNNIENPYLDKVLKRTTYISNLLEHSIELAEAGSEADKVGQVDLDRLISTVGEIIIPKSIIFSKDDLGIVHGDNGKLSQVFKNLFENAVVHGKPTKIHVSKSTTKKYTVISVSNDGKLISTDIAKKVFERGFTTKRSSTGLGLTIVKKLIEAHGWKIEIDTKDKLTNFRIKMPKKED